MKPKSNIKKFLVRGAAGKAESKVDKELAEALRDDPGKDDPPPKKEARQSTDKRPKKEPKEGEEEEEGEGSKLGGIASAFKKHFSAKEEKEDEKNEEEEEKEDEEEGTPISDKYKSILEEEIPKGVSSAVSQKMKTFKSGAEKAINELKKIEKDHGKLKRDFEELKVKGGQSTDDIEKNPVVTELRKKASELDETVQRLSLEDSEGFQKKYDDPRIKSMRKLKPTIQAIEDKSQRDSITNAIQDVLRISPGEDDDVVFVRSMNKITKMEGFPEDDKEVFKKELLSIRETWNARGEALSNWKETKREFDVKRSADSEDYAQRLEEGFDLTRSAFLKQNAKAIELLKQNEEAFGYSKMVNPILDDVKKELRIVAKTGELTPKILALIHNGVEFVYKTDLANKMQALLKEVYAENSKLKKKLNIKEDPEPGGKSGSKKEKEGEETKVQGGYGLVSALRKAGSR